MNRFLDQTSRKPLSPVNPRKPELRRAAAPAAPTLAPLIQRKQACSCGGTCPRCSEAASGLRVSHPGDAQEREADRVAAHIVGSSAATAAPPIAAAGPAIARKPQAAATAAAAGIAPSHNSGQPLPAATRAFMEPRFGHDLADVRVHTDDTAAASADALGARAYTVGNDVTFARGHYDTHSSAGNTLLAHELTHVIQQRNGGLQLQRDVTPQYELIEDRLTYGLFDWAITDANARDVLNLLNGLSDLDLADTAAAMDRDGLLDRLMENIAEEDQHTYAVLIGRINRHRSTSHTGEWIIAQLSYGTWDWAITDDDATRALMVLAGLESQELRTVVAQMVNSGIYDRLREELPAEQASQYRAFLLRMDSIRDEFNQLVSDQVGFFRNQKDEAGNPVDAGEVIKSTVQSTGYGGSKSTWDDLDKDAQDAWRERAAKAIAKVTASVAGTQLEQILKRGELVFIPEEAEKLNAYAYVSGKNKLYFGRGWVRDAEKGEDRVWQSIAHELGGHEEFGDTWSWQIMQAALARLTPEERAKATSGGNSVYSSYGYLETEIYAELRELPHRVPGSGGDKPEDDVPKELRRIKEAYSETVALQIVIRLYYRVAVDPRVSDTAKKLLMESAQKEFNLFPLANSPAP